MSLTDKHHFSACLLATSMGWFCLKYIDNFLGASETCHLDQEIVVTSLSDFGKTQTARRGCKNLREQSRDVFWVCCIQ